MSFFRASTTAMIITTTSFAPERAEQGVVVFLRKWTLRVTEDLWEMHAIVFTSLSPVRKNVKTRSLFCSL